MKITSSYGIEIRNMNKMFLPTVKIYQAAVKYCIDVFEQEWDNIEPLTTVYRKAYCEHLIHSTKNNKAKYPEFDQKFYKMPIYLLRDVIAVSIGQLSSYHSNLRNWELSDKSTKMPKLQSRLRKFPTFYKGSMNDSSDIENNKIRLKLYVNNDWKFVSVKLKHTDLQYIRNHFTGKHISNPTLEKRYDKWFLRFSVEDESTLISKHVHNQKILSVDLGVNTDAVCSVMLYDGTILGRKFINFPSDKDRITHCLNKIKKIQQIYGSKGTNTKKIWRYCKSLNDELARKISGAIIDYASKSNIDVIVFEHLDFKGKKHGKKKQKLSMWKRNAIQNMVTLKAHRLGIRISRICAWGTSKFAFDGSGEVIRGTNAELHNNKLCKFQTGKIYNCDLSASYNIGARYFIRELQKSMPTRVWSDITAKVPECQKRTKCTYNTLLMLNSMI